MKDIILLFNTNLCVLSVLSIIIQLCPTYNTVVVKIAKPSK